MPYAYSMNIQPNPLNHYQPLALVGQLVRSPPTLEEAATAFLEALAGKNRAVAPIKAYGSDLVQFIRYLHETTITATTPAEVVAARQDMIADYLRGFIQESRQRWQQQDERLTALEVQLSSGATISETQAAEIALAVKNIGQALAAQGAKSGYARVYSEMYEMYRRYHISSYKNLSSSRYDEVRAWLAGWYEALT